MKTSLFPIVIALSLCGFSAHAFITPAEQKALLSSLNKLNDGVHFEEVRCSARNRICLVRLELGPQKLPVGCSIEHLSSAEDLFKESAEGLTLSPYSTAALNDCISGFVR